MERAVEFYLAITLTVFAVSHLLRPADWTEAYRQLHAFGRPGAFVNGWLHIVPGSLVVAGHGSWEWPGAVLTGFGWLLIAKGIICLCAPGHGLRSMARAVHSRNGFIAGGSLLLAVGAWAWYCIWRRIGND